MDLYIDRPKFYDWYRWSTSPPDDVAYESHLGRESRDDVRVQGYDTANTVSTDVIVGRRG